MLHSIDILNETKLQNCKFCQLNLKEITHLFVTEYNDGLFKLDFKKMIKNTILTSAVKHAAAAQISLS